jgi:VIT1/CCC1 family predicted Fe2+/Mn2+ transporter
MGAAGASLSVAVVLAMTIAALFSDGITMAFGDFLGTKSEIDFEKKERAREKWEIENNPEAEKKEMLDIYID